MPVLGASVLAWYVALGSAYEVWANFPQGEPQFSQLLAALVPQVLLLLPSTGRAVMDLGAEGSKCG